MKPLRTPLAALTHAEDLAALASFSPGHCLLTGTGPLGQHRPEDKYVDSNSEDETLPTLRCWEGALWEVHGIRALLK